MKISLFCALFAFTIGLATPAPAAELRADGYTIHYNALSAGFLPQNVVDQLAINPDTPTGVVNITVVDDKGRAVDADVHGNARTLTGQKVSIDFQRIEDAGGASWLGVFEIPGKHASLRFKLAVTPTGGDTQLIEFVHDF